MAHPFDQQPNDLAVLQQSPPNQASPTVPLPEEFALDSRTSVALVERSRREKGWITLPEITVTPPRTLNISAGELLAPAYSTYQLPVSGVLQIPALSGTTGVVSQIQKLYVVVLALEVGGEQDPVLAQVSFKYRQEQPDGTVQILDTTKENTRRMRSAWVWVLSPDADLTANNFIDALTEGNDGFKYLSISDKTSSGFNIGGLRCWATDGGLVDGKTYKVFPNILNIFPLCEVTRRQNYPNRGYIWGDSGEEPFQADFVLSMIQPQMANLSPSDLATKRLQEIISGKPGLRRTFTKAVQNFVAGQVSGNPGRPGEATASPNGSVALATSQRVSFVNQYWTQDVGCDIITATNDGSGNALVPISLIGGTPGTTFHPSRDRHRIFKGDGTEQGALGSYLNLGGTGSLTWIAAANSTISSGETVYAVPAIQWAAGGGFGIPFDEITGAWVSGAAIHSNNIREAATDDLDSYEAPANGEDFIVIAGRERAGIHYIYKRVVVTADGAGVIAIPGSERGCFAFVDGVMGDNPDDPYRIDKPVLGGLTAGVTYNTLVYYPPRSSEQWQFELKYPSYQGTSESSFLDGAVITSNPLGYIHTQGGGLSVFQGDSAIALLPVAMYLPWLVAGTPSYEFDAPAQLNGESYPGPLTFRSYSFLPGAGLAMVSPGQTLSFEAEGLSQPHSIGGRLKVGDRQLGFKAPRLNNDAKYQAVLVFTVEKSQQKRLVVITVNTTGGDIEVDSTQNCAFDTFLI